MIITSLLYASLENCGQLQPAAPVTQPAAPQQSEPPTPPIDMWQFRDSPNPIAYDICQRRNCAPGVLMVKFFDDNQNGSTGDEMQKLQETLPFTVKNHFDADDSYILQLPATTTIESGLTFFQNHTQMIDYAEPSIRGAMQDL
jgi:hypothetical protein